MPEMWVNKHYIPTGADREHWSRNKQSSDRERERTQMLILGDYRLVVETVIFHSHWMVVESVFRCKEKRTERPCRKDAQSDSRHLPRLWKYMEGKITYK